MEDVGGAGVGGEVLDACVGWLVRVVVFREFVSEQLWMPVAIQVRRHELCVLCALFFHEFGFFFVRTRAQLEQVLVVLVL